MRHNRALTLILLTVVLTCGVQGINAVEVLEPGEGFTNTSDASLFILSRTEMEYAIQDSELLTYYEENHIPDLEEELRSTQASLSQCGDEKDSLQRELTQTEGALTKTRRFLAVFGVLASILSLGGIFLW